MPDDPKQVSYTIGTRLLTSGKVAVVMHLYREGLHALTSTLMTCDRRDLPVEVQSAFEGPRHSRDHETAVSIGPLIRHGPRGGNLLWSVHNLAFMTIRPHSLARIPIQRQPDRLMLILVAITITVGAMWLIAGLGIH